MSEKSPLVSVIMSTYKHEAFIAAAIEGVLQQETDFQIELIIGDDCSPDATNSICADYAKKHSEIIQLISAKENQGPSKNFINLFARCRGEYIANCDGDDCWTDPLKLQKQVDFMSAHPDFGLVYTDIRVIDTNGHLVDNNIRDEIKPFYSKGNVFFQLLKGNFISSCTVLYRKELLDFDVLDIERYWYVYDFWRWLVIATRSKIHFMDFVSSSYRAHSGGVTQLNFIHKRRSYYVLHDIMVRFDQYYTRPTQNLERTLVFRKMLSLLYRKHGTPKMKLEILQIIPRYTPSLRSIFGIFIDKFKKRYSVS